jgi:hypothetical protein
MDGNEAQLAITAALDTLEQDFAAVDVNIGRLRTSLGVYLNDLVKRSQPHDIQWLGKLLRDTRVTS